MAFSAIFNNPAVTRTAAALATVFGLSACAVTPPTYTQTAGMKRVQVVEGASMDATVEMDPCRRAGIEPKHIYDVSPQQVVSRLNNGEAVDYHRSVYLFMPKDATSGWQTALGAVGGAVLGNVAGKAFGLHGGSRTGVTVGGAIAGGVAGGAVSGEARVGNLMEKKACEQYIDGELSKIAPKDRDVAPYNIVTSPRGGYDYRQQPRRIMPQIIWTR
ncbi:MAG: hypothetical protein RBR86_08035 [Pseudobdellovibrionaceae bacterium]|jgi:outer membrane lipoprotein SlyB|nr:hypothetical protein [Pseudobdellovibrionaceae bacterium]